MRRDGDGEIAVVADEGAAGNAFGIKVVVCDVAMRCAVMDCSEVEDATTQSGLLRARDCL